MIQLTENQIEEIRTHTKHRKELRDKLVVLRSNRASFKTAYVRFEADGGNLEMKQGERGGFMSDMLMALEGHLIERIGMLTEKLAVLGVNVP